MIGGGAKTASSSQMGACARAIRWQAKRERQGAAPHAPLGTARFGGGAQALASGVGLKPRGSIAGTDPGCNWHWTLSRYRSK
jgi:hypothetical protein